MVFAALRETSHCPIGQPPTACATGRRVQVVGGGEEHSTMGEECSAMGTGGVGRDRERSAGGAGG
jgi:hypothetical protein